jgi:hypothetical protein
MVPNLASILDAEIQNACGYLGGRLAQEPR